VQLNFATRAVSASVIVLLGWGFYRSPGGQRLWKLNMD
jgi:hypothetical protein